MAKIQIIEDEPGLRKFLRHLLEQEGHTVIEAATGPEGVSLFALSRPDLVISDVALPGLDGIGVLQQIKALNPVAPVIVMTGEGTTEITIRAMAFGASEYLVKPFDPAKALRAIRQILLSSEVAPGEAGAAKADDPTSRVLIGKTEAMYEVFKLIGRVANQTSTVLILGESGTGKELVARAIHEYGSRAQAPFVVINCAAIPEALLESELFGYEKGAFTGADKQRQGKFEQARDGTLFLDEVGDMSPVIQAKLLRVLQDQEFYRVGGGETVRTNARIIAATNRDLRAESVMGRFREDLYFRLSVSVVRLPPLRERREDIPLLVDHLLRQSAQVLRRPVRGIAPAALDLLVRAEWRGNIRELSNVVQQAVLLAQGTILQPEQFANLVLTEPGTPVVESNLLFNAAAIRTRITEAIAAGEQNLLPPLLAELERAAITAVYDCCGGNVSLAAKHLGMHRVTLKSKLVSFGVTAE